MNDFKSVQDLIIKAALYDGVSTTIRPYELICGRDALRIVFSRDDRHSSTCIELSDAYRDPEEVALYCCKRALYKLLEAPYEEITYPKEN
jgi:hypothetical protein